MIGDKAMYPKIDALESALKEIFPPPCTVAARTIDSTSGFRLHPEAERRLNERAILKRQKEFQAGRIAARAALGQLGYYNAVVPAGADGAPQWPGGVVGSIDHAEGCAVAVTGRAVAIGGVGVDLELDGAVGEDIWPNVLRTAELDRLRLRASSERSRWATVAFCAKEAFYKLQYPITRAWVDFDSVDVTIDSDRHEFVVTIEDQRRTTDLPCRQLNGRFAFVAPFALAGISMVTE